LHDKKVLPGLTEAVNVLSPINDDRRFRQYNEIKIPSSNAVIFFMRDGSGSMDQYKCDIVSDIAYWLNLWICSHYDKTERVFIWHDTEARELSEKEFFGLRYGGGTYVSSALKMMKKIVKNRYNPVKWNIYGFYFGDGESGQQDNQEFTRILKKELGSNVLNMFGQVEILNYGFGSGWESLKEYIDKQQAKNPEELKHVRNTEIKRPQSADDRWNFNSSFPDEETRDKEIKRVLKSLLGKTNEERTQAKTAQVHLEEIT
jgi:uncharacterized sporulation protein YeaH/YhbH (DUF444 family)